MNLFRHLSIVMSIAGVLAALTSCGGGDDEPNPEEYFRASTDNGSRKTPIGAVYIGKISDYGVNIVFISDGNEQIYAPQIEQPKSDWFMLDLPTSVLGKTTSKISDLNSANYNFQSANSINQPTPPTVYIGDILSMELSTEYVVDSYFSIDMKAQLHNGKYFEIHYGGSPFWLDKRIVHWLH